MVSEIRCSQLARPMACAGFLSLENLPQSDSGAPAMEGTAFGEYVQWLLKGQVPPKQASNGVYFDDDMKFYAGPTVGEVNANRQSEVLTEQRIDWQTRSGIWIRGSYDRSFIREGALYIDDDKYGWGIVEVRDCWQLLAYAIGEVMRRAVAFEKIVLRINQPRPHHEDGSLREWILTYDELLEYKEKIEVRMEELARGAKDFQTGKHCKYCTATQEACPAFNRLFYRALEVSYGFTQDSIDERELATQLDHAARAAEVIKIKTDSLRELAVSRIKGGKIVPGYITESNFGDRKWKPGISPEVIETLTGTKVTERKMLSPAQAEKAGIDKKFIAALVDRHFIGQKLVKKDAGAVGDKIFGTIKPTMGGV